MARRVVIQIARQSKLTDQKNVLTVFVVQKNRGPIAAVVAFSEFESAKYRPNEGSQKLLFQGGTNCLKGLLFS